MMHFWGDIHICFCCQLLLMSSATWRTSDCTNTCRKTVTNKNFSHKLHKLVREIFRTKNLNLIAKRNKELQYFD